jgi:hypothetical protein
MVLIGLLWILLDIEMVEAGGIEPPSERFQSKASTCLSSALNLALTPSQRQDAVKASFSNSRPVQSKHPNRTSLLNDVRPTPRRHWEKRTVANLS